MRFPPRQVLVSGSKLLHCNIFAHLVVLTRVLARFLHEADSSGRTFLARLQVAEEVAWLKRNLPGPAAAADGTPGTPDQASAKRCLGILFREAVCWLTWLWRRCCLCCSVIGSMTGGLVGVAHA